MVCAYDVECDSVCYSKTFVPQIKMKFKRKTSEMPIVWHTPLQPLLSNFSGSIKKYGCVNLFCVFLPVRI